MPTHGYRTKRKPPTLLDHVLAHCWELGLSAWAMLGGLAAIVSALLPTHSVSSSLDRLPDPLAVCVGLLLVFGGIGVFRGLFDDSEDLMVGWRRERMGLVLTGAGWAAYGVAVVSITPRAVLLWLLCLFVVVMTGLRLWATVRSERDVREAVNP